jgi:hypothetical protein
LTRAEDPPSKAPALGAIVTKLLFDGQTLNGWIQIPADSWTVKDGAMASTGAGRGVIYSKDDYSHYRLMFKMRHVSGQPDHQACVLIFCTRPTEGEKPLDALAGIQFQPPNGGHWDYRKGHNNDGKEEFNRLVKPNFDPHEWSRVDLLVNADKGTARMAVAQPPESKAVEVLDFDYPEAGRKGPIAWQMHNKGLFDEYKDVVIEIDPENDELITVKQALPEGALK